MVWAIIVEIIVEYIAYIYVAAVFVYSNNQSRLMAHRARRAAAAARIGEDRKQMIKQPITSHKVLYGQALISGPMTFMHVTDSNTYLHILITLTAHKVAAIHDVYLNDEIIRFDEAGRVLGKYANVLVIKKGLGDEAGDAALHAYMTAQFPTEWTSAHRQTGCAKLYARLKFDMDLFPMGIPNLAVIADGKEIFDPRTNTSVYSNNYALCTRDYLVSAQYGLGGGAYVHNGTAQAAGAATLTLAAGASAVDNAYRYMTLRITGGAGIGQQRTVTGYVGATKIATVDRDWDVLPGITSTYSVTDPTSEINDTVLTSAADVCDEMVAVAAGQADTFVVGHAVTTPESNPITQVMSVSVAGTLTSNNYRYKYTFTTAAGETEPSPASSVCVGGGYDTDAGAYLSGIRISNIPLGTATVTGRKIYRSENGGAYYLAGTIADNVTTTFDDAGTVGAAAPSANTTDASDDLARSSVSPYLQTGDGVQVSTTGTLPAGLAAATTYYYISLGMVSGKLATTRANAFAGTAINITSNGTGTHTITKVSEARYACNGVVDTDETPKSVLGSLLTGCGGRLIYTGGQWQLQVAAYLASSGTLDEDDLDGPIKLQTLVGKRDLCNGVKGVFVNPVGCWQPTDFPPVTNATYTAADNYERLWRDMQLPFTVSPATAQRLAKIELEKVRQQITTVWPCKLSALRFQAGDTVALTNTRRGWSAKVFEITDLRMVLRETDGAPRLGVDLTLRETAAAIYDWNSGEETIVDLADNTNLPDANTVAAPGTLTAASGTNHLFLRADGTVFTRVYVSWDAITDQYVLSTGHVEIEYRRNDSTAADWEKGPIVPGTETSAYLLDVEDGTGYFIRARVVNSIGVRSAWSMVLHLVVGKTAPPATVTGFTAGQNGNVVVMKWTQVADIDLAGYEIRYIAQGLSSWDAAVPLTRVTRGTQVTTAALPPGSWTLLIAARDTSGNYSVTKSSYDIDVTNASDIIYQSEQAPDWLGTKTNFVKHWTGVLIPDSQDAASLDTWDTFDVFVPNPYASCTYEPAAIDVGFIDTVRVWASEAATLGPGETTGFPDPTLQIDYHSGAGYDGFEAWTIGDATGRYFKHKLVLDIGSGVAYVTGFSPTLDVAAHTESATGVVIGAAGTAIVFDNRFHFTPNIQLTVQGGTGYTASFTAQSATGFTAHVYNSSGTEVGGTIDWTATGD